MSTDKIDPSKKDETISSADDLTKTAGGDVELTEQELKRVAGGSLDATIHFKYDIKAQKEG